MWVKNNLISNNTTLYGPELDRVAINAIQEHRFNNDMVKNLLGPFIHDIDSNSTKDDSL